VVATILGCRPPLAVATLKEDSKTTNAIGRRAQERVGAHPARRTAASGASNKRAKTRNVNGRGEVIVIVVNPGSPHPFKRTAV
jgi:hypothetical protein